MPETVWINGRFLTRDDARVSAFDAGFVHAVGLFETMMAAPLLGDEDATRGRVVGLHQHLARLETSARELGLSDNLKIRPLAEMVEHVVERSGLTGPDQGEAPRARVRLTVTGGDLNLLSSTARGPADPTVVIAVQPATRYPSDMFERGVRVMIADVKANPLNPFEGHKTLNYWWRLRALQHAAAAGAGETLVLQVTNHVCGGAVSNLFALRDGELLTPLARGEEEVGAVPSPVLPGVTRATILDFAAQMGLRVVKRLLSINDVLDADEVFLTNSSWGVLPVAAVEGKAIGPGTPGLFTRQLRERWLTFIAEEP
jgi:branched-subunit amino acid aminotransferase/4-amino-4-deoxychorismate lyase